MSRMNHCGIPFVGTEVYRLMADTKALMEGFSHQDLIDGICQICLEQVLFWQGVYPNSWIHKEFRAISKKDRHLWLARRPRNQPEPIPNGCSKKRMNCVWSSAHIKPYQKRLILVK